MPNNNAASNSKITQNLTPDLYDIASYVGEIQTNNMDGVSQDTLMLGIFGYLREVFSQMTQNTIIMASEFANEGIPTKAKFEKNIIAHALGLGITSINAVPAQMEVHLTFIEDEIINALGGGSGDFVFDRDNQIFFDDLEFHPDYDIIIRRVRLANGNFTYTAMYDMTGDDVFVNPVSDITNPYLNPPVVMKMNGTRYLFVACLLRQVEKQTIYRKVLSDNTISSKTVNFDFESQLADFDVNVINANGTTHLTPVYEGLSTSTTRYPYIWYTYLDSDNIRLKFDRGSFYPRINSDVEICLQTTQGEKGNFTWSGTDFPQFYFSSERLGYTNIFTEVRPINNESMYGMDKKSVEELKEIIPKEALSRGSITTTTDLQNYFNAVDTSSSKMYFYKRRDNCLERLYYSYIVMKDSMNNIIPTNTTDIKVDPSSLETDPGSGKLILKRGQVLKLSADGNMCTLYEGEDPTQEPDYTDGFYYIIPYNFAINLDPMYGMYFLTTMNVNKNLGFTYINEECQYQYVSTYINWTRKYLTETDTYVLTMNVIQNITADDSMIEVDNQGNIIKSNVKAFIVFYNDEDVAVRYKEGTIGNYNTQSGTFDFTFKFTSNDLIDSENNIRIAGLDQAGYAPGEGLDYAYLPGNTKAMIHIITYQPEFSTKTRYDDIFGNTNIDINEIIPLVGGWCVTNSYEILSGLDFFYNYSEIVYSNIEMLGKEDDEPIPDPDDPYAKINTIQVTINGDPYIFRSVGDPITQGQLSKAQIEEFILQRFADGNADFFFFFADPADTTKEVNDINLDVGDGTSLTLQYVPRKEDPLPGTEVDPDLYSYYFRIHNVPLIKHDYFRNESMVVYFCNELIRRKSYIDEAIRNLEDSFGMDFKFFNTYGPSKMYTLDNASNYLNRVNLSLTFKLGLQVNYDENIIQYITDDVKTFVENINEIDSVHMSNLVTEITSKYEDSITFFEFIDFNGYGPGEQHLYAMQMPEDVITPELVNINMILQEGDVLVPDITIIIA